MRSDADRNFSLTHPPQPGMYRGFLRRGIAGIRRLGVPGLAGREVPILLRMRGLR